MRLRKFEMSNFSTDMVWTQFDRAEVEGRSVALCELCDRQLVPDGGVMSMHYRMKHCKPADNSRQSDPLASKPLSDKPKTLAPPESDRDVYTSRCLLVW